MDISVRITRDENAEFFGVEIGDVVRVPFEQYVASVVASEVGNALPEACKAQAIASRTFAVSKGVLEGKTISDSSSSDQAYRASRTASGLYPNAVSGTQETEGQILTYNGKAINAVYSACNGGRTVSSQERWGGVRPYLIAQDDPWDNSTKRTGHGVGMSQRGAKYAASIGKTHEEILAFYYPGTEIKTLEKEGGDQMVTAWEFVAQVLIPLQQAWGYIYGQWGVYWTQALQDKMNQTTEEKYANSRRYGAKWIGHMVLDCAGLVYWALMQLNVKTVHHARYLYTDWCKHKGRMVNGQPEDGHQILPGTLVFLKGSQDHIHHVGVYVGHGVCVEAKGVQYGVVTSELSHWDYWGELRVVDYTDAARLENEEMPEVPEKMEDDGVLFKAQVTNPRSYLNVRNAPDEKATRVFRVENGSIVDVITQESQWWQIKYGRQIGWAWAAYLTPLEEEEPEAIPDDDAIDEPDYDVEVRSSVMDDLQAVLQTMSELENKISDIIRRL